MDKRKVQKIIAIILIGAILITGITMMAVSKFNISLDYKAHQRIELFIGKAFKEDEMHQIVKEVFGNQEAKVQSIEVFDDMVSIATLNVTEDQKDLLIKKINEKYGTELNKELDMDVYQVPSYRGRDMIKRYIAPSTISMVLILGYIAVRYRKLGITKNLLKVIASVLLVEILYLCIFAIIRIPVNQYTIPGGLVLGIVTLFGFIVKKEKELEQKNETQKKKKA